MSLDRIDYPHFLQEALRDVVRRALQAVAEHGLPRLGFFSITFRTLSELGRRKAADQRIS